jgi:P27 family predicted phage terminase small subunit
MAGREPKPTALKLVEGNPGKRKLNQNEPRFTGSPKCPAWLAKEAKAEWKRVTKELAALDLLKSTDTAALASYCQSYARWQQAEQTIEAEGQTIKEPIVSKSGNIVGYKTKRHPATTIAKDEKAAMLRSASLFGFDPSSRSRIHCVDAQQQDPFEAFMNEIGADDLTEYEPTESSGTVH